jgi:hypothetical protein
MVKRVFLLDNIMIFLKILNSNLYESIFRNNTASQNLLKFMQTKSNYTRYCSKKKVEESFNGEAQELRKSLDRK